MKSEIKEEKPDCETGPSSGKTKAHSCKEEPKNEEVISEESIPVKEENVKNEVTEKSETDKSESEKKEPLGDEDEIKGGFLEMVPSPPPPGDFEAKATKPTASRVQVTDSEDDQPSVRETRKRGRTSDLPEVEVRLTRSNRDNTPEGRVTRKAMDGLKNNKIVKR